MHSSAIFSDCGRYRYSLSRRWENGENCVFVGLNPSTADSAKNDATVRKCIHFARSWGFADTHVRVGILPGWGLPQNLSRLIGLGRAKELSLSGNFVSAQDALRLGLVNKVCPADELMTEALAIAKQIAESAPAMVTAYKSLIDDGYDSPFGEALKLEDERSTRWAQDVDYSVMADRLAQLRSRASKQR